MDFIFNGKKINYTDCGSGDAVVFLHGWGASLRCFDFVVPYLSDYRVIRIDLPGHGESEEPENPLGVKDFADCVKAVLSELKAENPTLVGHSNGGRVIISMLAEGYAAKRAVLIDSAGIIPKRSLSYRLKVIKYKAAKKLIKLFYGKNAAAKLEKIKKKSGSADYRNASGVMRDTMVKLVNTDLEPELCKISVPTLLIWGTADTETPYSDGKKMESEIKDSGMVTIEGGSHWAFAQRPDIFVSALLSFLKS